MRTHEPTRFHVALNVADLAHSVAFYRQVLGLEPDKLHRGYARFLVSEPPLVLSLSEGERVKPGTQVAHFGVRLGSSGALAAARERVGAGGHAVRDQKGTLCCHAVQDKFWVTDPDGNLWEFYQVLDDHPERGSPGGRASTEAAPQARKPCC
jgi:catechol 2,3-dioxygenase-like lactoylglutathione lyase family enzyme